MAKFSSITQLEKYKKQGFKCIHCIHFPICVNADILCFSFRKARKLKLRS